MRYTGNMSVSNRRVGSTGSTKGEIVRLLRRASRRVSELAEALSVSDNAIRSHLAVLERDGVVQQTTARGHIGKPAFVYSLTPEAERLFPKAYETVLGHLLDVLEAQVGSAQREALLRDVGHSIAGVQGQPSGSFRERLEGAVSVLNNLGGLAELEEHDNEFSICGYRCPLSAMVATHPETCKLVESLLADLIGVSVEERCERGDKLSCSFQVHVPKH